MTMRGSVISLLAVAVLSSGCNTRQRVAGGGVGLAVVGVALSFSTENREDATTQEKVGIACLLTGLVVLFVAAALEESATEKKAKEIKLADRALPPAPTVDQAAVAAQKKRDEAWALTKQAHEAARAGDCAKVTELSAKVGALDAEFYADVFMKDEPTQQCFVPVETPPAPAPAPAPVPAVTPQPR